MVCDIKVSQEQFFTEIIASHMMFNCGAKVLDNFILDGFVSWPVSREWSEFKSKITSVRLYLDILVKIEGFWPSICSNTGLMSKWGKVKPKEISQLLENSQLTLMNCSFHYLGYYCSPNLFIHLNSTQELTWNFLVTLGNWNNITIAINDRMIYYAWKMRAPRSHCFSPHMNNRHLWQLKKK